jgi:hypothetical protein
MDLYLKMRAWKLMKFTSKIIYAIAKRSLVSLNLICSQIQITLPKKTYCENTSSVIARLEKNTRSMKYRIAVGQRGAPSKSQMSLSDSIIFFRIPDRII